MGGESAGCGDFCSDFPLAGPPEVGFEAKPKMLDIYFEHFDFFDWRILSLQFVLMAVRLMKE